MQLHLVKHYGNSIRFSEIYLASIQTSVAYPDHSFATISDF